jgi:hypothetical protein
VKQLGAEKDALQQRVVAAAERAKQLPDGSAYASVCSSLRRALDEEVKLSQQLQVRWRHGTLMRTSRCTKRA